MRKQMILTTLVASLAGVCAGHAQEPRDFSLLAMQTVQLPGTTYSVVFNSPELQIGEPRDMAALSVAIGSWLSANFGLPALHDLPRVEHVSASEIESRQSVQLLETETMMENPAVYDGRSHAIYLPEGWNGTTPAELSVFVRQMLRHLQNEAKNAYHCTPDSNKFALVVQRRWLAMFGADGQQVNAVGTNGLASGTRCVSRQSRIDD